MISLRVARLGLTNKLNDRLHPDYPFLKSEILFSIRNELAEKPNDILCRRVPIAFLNSKIAKELIPLVVDIMAKEKKWGSA